MSLASPLRRRTLATVAPVRRSTALSGSEAARRMAQPVPVRRLVLRFALAGLPAVLAAVVVTAWASVRVGTQQGIEDAKRVAYVSGRVVEELGLDDAIATRDPAATAKLDRVVQEFVKQGAVVRVKVWTREGLVVYSDAIELIGQEFQLADDSLRALANPSDPQAEVTNVDKDENAFETETKLLEVYQGIRTPNGTPLLFETYFSYDRVAEVGRSMWREFAPIAVGCLLLLELVQIPFAWSLARRLRVGQQQRERLLQHAIESSDAERRRIASDLHDGVVQELTGVSMTLSAATLRGGTASPETVMTSAGHQIRESVKSLRSLLVDIYPPNLHEEGLTSALADLLGSLHNRGLLTELDVSIPEEALTPQNVSLLYRAAQEAVRNVASHARASRVAVTVARQGEYVSLVIDDDGLGFDDSQLATQTQAGHVGLRSLAGLLTDAGGALEIRSAVGAGTRVDVRIPL